MDKVEKSTELQILDAARKVFYRKGLSGARMQEIADEAGINKAMLHYYFRNKEKLFSAIFKEGAMQIFPKIIEYLQADLPLFEKIENFTEKYLTLLQDNCYMPAFVLHELSQNSERFLDFIGDRLSNNVDYFVMDVNKAIASGAIKETDPKQLIMNMMSLCIFPIVTKPMVKMVLKFTDEEYNDFIEQRKKEIPEFIINSIKK